MPKCPLRPTCSLGFVEHGPHDCTITTVTYGPTYNTYTWRCHGFREMSGYDGVVAEDCDCDEGD